MSLRSTVLTLARLYSREYGRLASLALALTLGIAAAPMASLADTIYLKNGRKIIAEVTREDSKQVYYEAGGGEFAIPRSLVDRIEKSASPSSDALPTGSSSAAGRGRDLPLPPPPGAETTPDAQSPVIKDNALDNAYLSHLDNEFIRNPSAENRRRMTQGYQEAAIFLTRTGDPETAIEQYRHALKFDEDDPALTLGLAYLLVKQNHHSDAIQMLLPLAVRHPESADIHVLLGSAYYATEDLNQAISEWNKALATHDDPRLREALAKAEKERNVAGSFQELRSEHFLLRYDEENVKQLANEVLRTLEDSFLDLESDLDVYPREPIVVLLYPDQAFRDITRVPSWVGALNDGKIRVPVSGLTSMTPALARVLKHELTHSFVRQITLGRCPVWFNEGLAQLEEGATTAGYGTQLSRALAGGQIPPYSALEASFIDLSQNQVGLAYAKSLAALEYLRDTFGQGEIRLLLKTMASNPDLSSLLQAQIRLTYPSFEQEITNYIAKRYGS